MVKYRMKAESDRALGELSDFWSGDLFQDLKAPFGNLKNNGDFAWFFANRWCGLRLLEARRNHRLATLRAISKINNLTWFLV
jgi:hypothetical protein